MPPARNYYNENDLYNAHWLYNLIQRNLIPQGDVDTRSIEDVKPADLVPYTQCHFFAGIGGWSLALRLAGWPDHREVWTGSCPCQPFSAAGKNLGFADERHLWPAWHHLIGQRRPPTIFGEQVARASDWLRLVRSDLEALDYAVGAVPIEAASAGADQLRDRFWFVADNGERRRFGTAGRQAQQPRRAEIVGAGAGDMADSAQQSEREPQHEDGAFARRDARPDAGRPVRVDLGSSSSPRLAFGSIAEVERGDVRIQGPPAGSASDRGQNMGCTNGPGRHAREPATVPSRHGGAAESAGDRGYEWVLGADGKARRVKPGIRLLAHGIPARVAKLRAFGNAIYPPCAAEFIKSYMDCRP